MLQKLRCGDRVYTLVSAAAKKAIATVNSEEASIHRDNQSIIKIEEKESSRQRGISGIYVRYMWRDPIRTLQLSYDDSVLTGSVSLSDSLPGLLDALMPRSCGVKVGTSKVLDP